MFSSFSNFVVLLFCKIRKLNQLEDMQENYPRLTEMEKKIAIDPSRIQHINAGKTHVLTNEQGERKG